MAAFNVGTLVELCDDDTWALSGVYTGQAGRVAVVVGCENGDWVRVRVLDMLYGRPTTFKGRYQSSDLALVWEPPMRVDGQPMWQGRARTQRERMARHAVFKRAVDEARKLGRYPFLRRTPRTTVTTEPGVRERHVSTSSDENDDSERTRGAQSSTDDDEESYYER
jgi:hypothetical protein